MKIILWFFKWFQTSLREKLVKIEVDIVNKKWEYELAKERAERKREKDDLLELVKIEIKKYNESTLELEKQRENCLDAEEMFAFKNVKLKEASDLLVKVSNHMQVLHITSNELNELLRIVQSSDNRQKIADQAFSNDTVRFINKKLKVN